ncbi:SWF or SNF family helicase [Streptomyces albus subsp. chlorinus]|uniref:SWIM zinc finger family protein n=1 Tax=Streptomyces albus TaxID=1888 RepID=UPI00156E7AFC|nr:SWF or SNF family helicase [Streptomyces albus]NSC25145.1 SWF or SNF family helicase [Streptomyces albus subsp. chlorinus]
MSADDLTTEGNGLTEESGADTRERVFAPLPPARGRGFTRTWWGQTWLTALEETALDGKQLKQGRALARQGAVGAVSVRPGRITSVVLGADRTPFRADVLLRELDEGEWDRLLDVIVEQSGHIAALLDREMPPRLVEDAADAGLELLPGIGDLDPECTCGSWDHCPHTAALSYQMARLLDEDPFALLLLRGRAEQELVETLQARSAARAAEDADGLAAGTGGSEDGPEGVDAAEAFALGAVLPPLPPAPGPVAETGQPAALEGGTSGAPGLDVDALDFLALDAASRARRMLAEALSPDHATRPAARPLTVWEDAVRLAAARPSSTVMKRLAQGCGRREGELEAAVRAWGFGGPEALAVLAGDTSPAPEALERAQQQLDAAWTEEEGRPVLRRTGARWTVPGADAQLRHGPDGRWWPYRRHGRVWWPVGGPERDPAAALAVALASGEEAFTEAG